MIGSHDHISTTFNNELSNLNESLLEMGRILENMYEKSIIAFDQKSEDASREVILNDKKIDDLETSIINQIQMLIAKRQPMGVDLRVLVGCTRIAGYMERIGDLISSVNKRSIILIEHNIENEKKDIVDLFSSAMKLFKKSLDCFARKDFKLAEIIRKQDLDIDKKYKHFFNELLEKMSNESKLVVPGTHMLFIAKNLERIGDHATNIADAISYMATGEVQAPERPKISE